MRRGAALLLRSGCAPRASAGAARALSVSTHCEASTPAPRGSRATASSAPAGWAASVLEAAASRLHEDEEEDEDAASDDELDDEEVPARRRGTRRAAIDSDSDDEAEDDEEDEPPPRPPLKRVQNSTLRWPPSRDALAGAPLLAEAVRPHVPPTARHTC